MISLLALLQKSNAPDRSQIRGSIMIRSAILSIAILFCLLPQTALAEEYPRCMTENNYLAHFDPRLTPQPCEVITTAQIRWGSRSATLRAIRLSSMPMTDSSVFIGHIRQAAAAIGSALERMGGNPNLSDITVLFTNYVSPRWDRAHGGFQKGAYLAAASSVFSNECPVSYYKDIAPSPGETFIFYLTHEAFHCVQYSTWPGMPRENWLIEGSADYFAFLVKPDFGPRFIPDFDRDISSVPLSRMAYSAVPFYLWLGDAYGPPRVREFLDSARTIETAIPPDMLSEFAKAYFGPTIRMPEGRAMPSTPATPATRSIRGNTRIASPVVTPYTLKSEFITFERGNVYELSQLPAPSDARTAWRFETDIAFGEMPTRISTCDGEKRFLVVRTTTTSRRAGDINVTAQPPSSNVCACPAGTWRETTASARRYFEQKGLGIYAGTESTKYISGGRVLTLNPDHTGSLTYVNVLTVTTGSSDLTLRQTKTGGSRFTWSVADGELRTVLAAGNNLITLNNEITTPSGVRYETRQAGAQTIYHHFSCDSSGLHLRQIGEAPRLNPVVASTFNTNMDFVRVADVP